MCIDSKINPSPSNFKMEARFQENQLHKNCSKLLEFAATDDLPAFIHEIEEKGCDVDEVSFWYGKSFNSKKMGFEERTPIMIACLYGSTEVLKYVIRTRKIDVNRACGSDGATALHCAAAGGSWPSVEVVRILIAASADINALDANGKKPGDLIANCIKLSGGSTKKTLEMLLNGVISDIDDDEGTKTPPAVSEKKEYPIDVSLPDINHGLYGSDEFRMYSFKVKPCSRAYSHDWTECPFVHPGENARRRDPRKYHYTCVPCPEFKKGSCAKGDLCEYAHGVFESWLHPAQYRTRLCKDDTGCGRKVCFFAHKPEELRPLYASTGSAMPSPKSVSINTSSPPMTPSVITCSSPMGGSMWSNKVNLLTPPALQLPGSRLKTALSARDIDLEVDKILLQQKQQQLADEMASLHLSSPYGRGGDLNPTNLDDVFGSLDPTLMSPSGYQIRQNMNQLRSSYPANISSSPSRKSTPYGFDSSAAVAAAVMNSRSSAFAKRSQSFIDRSGVGYRSPGPTNSSLNMMMPSKTPEWGSSDGKLDWGFNGEDVSKFRKSASFGYRSGSGNGSTAPVMVSGVGEPDVSWVNSLVRDVPPAGGGGPEPNTHWFDQMYIEKEQIVA